MSLLERLARREQTPSRRVAVRQAVSAVQVGLVALREDYRTALRLR